MDEAEEAARAVTAKAGALVLDDEAYVEASCLIFERSSPVRFVAFRIVTSSIFEWFVMVCIVASSVFLAMESPYQMSDSFKELAGPI